MRLDNNIISNASDYFEKIGVDVDTQIDWDETGDKSLISIEQYNLIGEIISTQVSFWCLRRLSNSCESNCDHMIRLMKDKISQYEIKYGGFKNFNLENIW